MQCTVNVCRERFLVSAPGKYRSGSRIGKPAILSAEHDSMD